MDNDLVKRLRKQAICIHIAAEQECANDVSDGLTKAADRIEALEACVLECEGVLKFIHTLQVRIGERQGSAQEHVDWMRELAKEQLDKMDKARELVP